MADQRSKQVIARIKKLGLPAELKQQLINAKVYDIWFNSKDLAPLSNLLSDHEKIEYAALGITDQGEDVMLTCTNQNLIILSKKHPSENSRVIPLTEIMSVLLQQQIISEELTLIVNNEQVNINLLNRTTAALLTATIKKWSRNNDNLDEQVEQIKKLKDLLDQGILTEEEFQAKKKQILKI